MDVQLPVPVLKGPHWRVLLRPESHVPELIPSLSRCFEIVEQTKVRLRGWDYPHLSTRQNQRGQGANWVGSWSDFMGHNEYWRFYQSGQFIYLSSIREASESRWRSQLEKATKIHLSHLNVNWVEVRGFFSIVNFLYTVTEIFEFAARLSQKGIYRGNVSITIELNDVRGFVLTTDQDRFWDSYYSASENNLGKTWMIRSDVLIAESAFRSLEAVVWFFERFGWFNLPVDGFANDQAKFLKGLV